MALTADSYISVAELRAVVGVGTDRDVDLARACIHATAWVRLRCGDDGYTLPVLDPPPAVITATPVETTPGRHAAALAAGTRFWQSPQAPFGIIGGLTDSPVYVSGIRIPEAELALLGEKVDFGVA